MLIVVILSDIKSSGDDFVQVAILYFPFMVAIPKLVFHYEFIILITLIPFICRLWRDVVDKTEKWILFAIAVGILLTQVQSFALVELLENITIHYIPGLGLMLVLIGIVFLKITKVGPLFLRGR
jgi:hypothetical protein